MVCGGEGVFSRRFWASGRNVWRLKVFYCIVMVLETVTSLGLTFGYMNARGVTLSVDYGIKWQRDFLEIMDEETLKCTPDPTSDLPKIRCKEDWDTLVRGYRHDQSCTKADVDILEQIALADLIIHGLHVLMLLFIISAISFFANLPVEELLKVRHAKLGWFASVGRNAASIVLKIGPFIHWLFVLTLLAMLTGRVLYVRATRLCAESSTFWADCYKTRPESKILDGSYEKLSNYTGIMTNDRCMYNQLKNCMYYHTNLHFIRPKEIAPKTTAPELCGEDHPKMGTSFRFFPGRSDIRSCDYFLTVSSDGKPLELGVITDDETRGRSYLSDICMRVMVLKSYGEVAPGERNFHAYVVAARTSGHYNLCIAPYAVLERIKVGDKTQFACNTVKGFKLIDMGSKNSDESNADNAISLELGTLVKRDLWPRTNQDDNKVYTTRQDCNTFRTELDTTPKIHCGQNNIWSSTFGVHGALWIFSAFPVFLEIFIGFFIRRNTQHEPFYLNPGSENFELTFSQPFYSTYKLLRSISP